MKSITLRLLVAMTLLVNTGLFSQEETLKWDEPSAMLENPPASALVDTHLMSGMKIEHFDLDSEGRGFWHIWLASLEKENKPIIAMEAYCSEHGLSLYRFIRLPKSEGGGLSWVGSSNQLELEGIGLFAGYALHFTRTDYFLEAGAIGYNAELLYHPSK